ncbi:MAG: ATP-binding protein, partial [Dehalococcoidia bacterium]
MAESATFGDLLRQYRTAAGLSQDLLAERAGLSTRAVSDLERGARRAPYRHTVTALAEALALSTAERIALEDAVRRARVATPPVSTSTTPPPGNLPAPLTSFVGRTREIEEVRRLLGSARLLTLLGAGGIGKTRLALMAAGQADGFPDGAWFVDLAALGDAQLVSQAVAAALGVREAPGRPLVETLGDALQSKRLLVILDNCEHVIAAVRTLAESLLRACSGLHILATSRENLGLANETVWRVPSMALPAVAGQPATGNRQSGGVAAAQSSVLSPQSSDALRLFLDRAQSALPALVLTEANAEAMVQICRRLDGIPLALELAAARVTILTPEQIAGRLDDRFRLLTSTSAFAPSRQQTLRATLDWSHDLLTEPERQLFRRLAVFAGGCDIEAVESVCTDRESDAIFDLLSALADKSLITVEYQGDTARYRLLETVRAYAAERLTSAGERDAMRRRHARYLRSVTDAADAGLVGPEQDRWLRRLETDLDNVRAALLYA